MDSLLADSTFPVAAGRVAQKTLSYLRGITSAPDLRASLSAIATACFRLLTFLPLPDFNVPLLCSFITLRIFCVPLCVLDVFLTGIASSFITVIPARRSSSKPGAARNNAYLPVVEVPVLSEVLFPLSFESFVLEFWFDFLSDLSDVAGVLDIPDVVVLPELVPGVVDVPGVLVPGVVVEPGVVVLGADEPGELGVPAPPACANKSEPPRKTPTAGVSTNANFLFMLFSFSGR